MNDAAVVAGLMGGDAVLLVHNDDLRLREAARDLQRGCQPDNSSADNKQLRCAISHGSSPAKPAIIRRLSPARHDAGHRSIVCLKPETRNRKFILRRQEGVSTTLETRMVSTKRVNCWPNVAGN